MGHMGHKGFWRIVGIGLLLMAFVLGATGALWFGTSSSFVKQRGYQAKYLLVIAGDKKLSDLSSQDQEVIRPLVTLTSYVKNESDPEKALINLFKELKATVFRSPGSYIYQLDRRHPGEINKAIEGDAAFGQRLLALYQKTKGVKFFPFWMTLMILALIWMIGVVDYAAWATAGDAYEKGYNQGVSQTKQN